MYARYVRTRVDKDVLRYELKEQASLFGCKNGFIPWLLGLKLKAGQEEPCAWHIDVVSELGGNPEYPKSTLVIDLKPKQSKTNLSLYEVLDVWGYSQNGWSPLLLRLNGLYVDADPLVVNRSSFVRRDDEVQGPIYEFLYVAGSVTDGKPTGLWVPPPASPTNAALLWPDALNYFFECIRETTPSVFKS
jgi:hypothetical protein